MHRRNETRCIVAKLTTQQAAEAVGRSRSTVWRDIRRGRLSAERADGGDFQVDVSELERVYGALKPPATSREGAAQPSAPRSETNTLQVEVALLHERVASLESDKHRLLSDLDREREERTRAAEERGRLLTILEEQSAQVRLLTDQRTKRRPWWRRWW
jgi:excisionase family DNA binding protein